MSKTRINFPNTTVTGSTSEPASRSPLAAERALRHHVAYGCTLTELVVDARDLGSLASIWTSVLRWDLAGTDDDGVQIAEPAGRLPILMFTPVSEEAYGRGYGPNRRAGALFCDDDQLMRRPWTLGMDGLASGQHLDELLDAPGSGLGLLGASNAIKNGVPIRTGERLKPCVSPRIGDQSVRQVLWNFHAGLPGVGVTPATIRLRLSNLVFA